MLDLETLRQRAQLAAGITQDRTLTLTWSEVIDIITEIEELQHEVNAANEETGHEQERVDSLSQEVDDLLEELDDLRQQNRELIDSGKCRECGCELARTICNDCYHTGGR